MGGGFNRLMHKFKIKKLFFFSIRFKHFWTVSLIDYLSQVFCNHNIFLSSNAIVDMMVVSR